MELALQLWRDPRGGLARTCRIARDAEAAGYGSLSVPDHLADGLSAPLTTCAALIGATASVAIGPLVLNNDLRHPVVLAREAATLAEYAGGRFELGLGAGHVASEYTRAGLAFDPPDRRIARLSTSLTIVAALLRGERVDHIGDDYRVAGEQIVPAPHHPVPILVGGNSRALLDCAATQADIVGLTGFSERAGGAGTQNLRRFGTNAAETQVARIQRVAAAAGRTPRIQVLVQWAQITRNRRRAAKTVAAAFGVDVTTVLDSPYVLLGTRREIVAQIADHHERLGATRWTLFQSAPGGYPPPLRPFGPVAEAIAGL